MKCGSVVQYVEVFFAKNTWPFLCDYSPWSSPTLIVCHVSFRVFTLTFLLPIFFSPFSCPSSVPPGDFVPLPLRGVFLELVHDENPRVPDLYVSLCCSLASQVISSQIRVYF